MSIPKAFISYSHDSPEHKNWVLDLATRLRSSGVDAVIDQWDLRPGDDLAHFMETQLTAAGRSGFRVGLVACRGNRQGMEGTGTSAGGL